jgi:hypothetical protein
MNKQLKPDDIIFDFFKQICDEKDNDKCVKLGKTWIEAMKTNLINMEAKLQETDKIKHKQNIKKNKDYLNSLKNNTSSEWRDFAKKCMIEILENKNNTI